MSNAENTLRNFIATLADDDMAIDEFRAIDGYPEDRKGMWAWLKSLYIESPDALCEDDDHLAELTKTAKEMWKVDRAKYSNPFEMCEALKVG